MSQNVGIVMTLSLVPTSARSMPLTALLGGLVLAAALAPAAASPAGASDPDHPGGTQRLAKLEAPAARHAGSVAGTRASAEAAAGIGANPCLRLLADDPADALDYAQDWSKHGGGGAAAQCAALSTLALGDPAAAAAALDRLARAPGSVPARQAALADEAAQAWLLAGKPDRALQAARIASGLVPDDPDLLVDHARAANAAGRPAEAVAVLGARPLRADALVARAGAYRALGRLAEARADIEAACLAAPDAPAALLERGVVRERLGDLDGARRDWTRILSVSPDAHEADMAQQDLALLDAGPEAR